MLEILITLYLTIGVVAGSFYWVRCGDLAISGFSLLFWPIVLLSEGLVRIEDWQFNNGREKFIGPSSETQLDEIDRLNVKITQKLIDCESQTIFLIKEVDRLSKELKHEKVRAEHYKAEYLKRMD